MFCEYQTVDHDLYLRETEIRLPWRESDQNIGGGRSATTADAAERTLEAVEADKRIIYLRRLKATCESAMSHFDNTLWELYKARYQSPSRPNWNEVVDRVPYSRSAVYRYRYCILELLAKEMGWLP